MEFRAGKVVAFSRFPLLVFLGFGNKSDQLVNLKFETESLPKKINKEPQPFLTKHLWKHAFIILLKPIGILLAASHDLTRISFDSMEYRRSRYRASIHVGIKPPFMLILVITLLCDEFHVCDVQLFLRERVINIDISSHKLSHLGVWQEVGYQYH